MRFGAIGVLAGACMASLMLGRAGAQAPQQCKVRARRLPRLDRSPSHRSPQAWPPIKRTVPAVIGQI